MCRLGKKSGLFIKTFPNIMQGFFPPRSSCFSSLSSLITFRFGCSSSNFTCSWLLTTSLAHSYKSIANAPDILMPPPPLIGDTRGKPQVFTSFSVDLGSPAVGECTFFHGCTIWCGGWAGVWQGFHSWFVTSFRRLNNWWRRYDFNCLINTMCFDLTSVVWKKHCESSSC